MSENGKLVRHAAHTPDSHKVMAPQTARDATRQNALQSIDDQFSIGKSVAHMQNLMEKVTDKEVTADTVNAACNCVGNINLTIKTAIQAAHFLAGR